MSAPLNLGVQEILDAAAANKLQQVLAEPQEEDDYELFDFEKDENDPDYRTVTVSYDGNSFVLGWKVLSRSSIPPTSLILGHSDICTSTFKRAVRSIK